MKRHEVDRNKISPMMKQYLEIKDNYQDAILFYRLGDFYEMFFDDAEIASRELELVLTGRNASLDEKIPMCGVPFHSYLPYLEKLVDKGYKVAICEQLSDPKEAKGVVERGVVQVVSKGTILDDTLEAKDNNYIANIYDFNHCFGFSFADISTGYFYVTLVDADQSKIIEEVIKRRSSELIVSANIDRTLVEKLRLNNVGVTITDNLNDDDKYKYIYEDLDDIRLSTTVKHLLAYILNNKKGDLSHLQVAEVLRSNKYLEFDIHTQKNLELVETIRNSDRTYSLLWLLDKTKTAMGSRLLKYNILNPLRDKKELNSRYDSIEKFLTEFILKDELEEELKDVYDLERLLGRINYGNLNARDLLQLKRSIATFPKIKDILSKLSYNETITPLVDLFSLLDTAINEEAPITIREGNIIKSGYNKELDELKEIRSGSKDFILKIEAEEKARTGIKTLKVGFNKVFGYYIEVSKGSINQVKEEYGYERKQTLSNSERFITPILKEKEDIILNAEEKIFELEYRLFLEIREKVKAFTRRLQESSKVLAKVDMLLSLATAADKNNYVRPSLNDKNIINIKSSRHPVVEKVIKDKYISNDIIMDDATTILLITGPNMAGKSTYMRQLAITAIMVQIGSFVAASSCEIPIFDKIFTRIGASDDLVSGDSTFMVEMKEANNALSNATKDSLLIFDELGRGTATFDGMSLAQSIIEYIHDKIGAKTLFSTHYHELTNSASDLYHLRNIHVSASEEDGELIFHHKIKSGAIDKSYGIHVASLAKLPKEVIDRARDILNVYEKKESKNKTFTQTSLFLEEEMPKTENKLVEAINNLDPLTMTPIDALNKIYELKKEIENDKK